MAQSLGTSAETRPDQSAASGTHHAGDGKPREQSGPAAPPSGSASSGVAAMASSRGMIAAVPPELRGRSRRKPIILGAVLLALMIGGILGYRYWQDATLYVSTDNA